MLTCIPAVLDAATLGECRARLDTATWLDGRGTAGPQSGAVKRNRQLAPGCPVAAEVGTVIRRALWSNPVFISAVLPAAILPPLFNRYEGGEDFGLHIDNAIRADPETGQRLRTDVSATLFFSDPDTYDGGELVIETLYGAQQVKLEAGGIVVYPGASLHQVMPVTAGTRLASFFWIQSMVREAERRTMLFELDQSIQALGAVHGLNDANVLRLTGVYHNLIRQWATP